MTLHLDSRIQQPPTVEAVASFSRSAPDVGEAVMRALDGSEIDLSNLHCSEQVSGFIGVAGRTHFVRITEASRPAPGVDDHTMFMLPGWTEMVERGTGANLHDAVAERFPASRILSIATDGVGMHCQPLSWDESMHLSFSTQGSDRLEIAAVVAAEGPTTLAPVSMGTVIGLETALLNLSKQRLQLEHIINHSHAQVSLAHVPIDMVLRFPLHMAFDGVREGIQHPKEAADAILGFLAIVATHAPAYAGNLRNLLRGTDIRNVFRVAQDVPTTFIFGTKDPLKQEKQLRRLERALPGQVRLMPIPGKGHAVSLDSKRAAQDFAKADIHGLAA